MTNEIEKRLKRTWVSADPHYGHVNIMKYQGRPFNDINHHDFQMIRNWNDRVSPGDDAYIIGDFCFDERRVPELLKKLNGNIHLIKGNHDRYKYETFNMFVWARDVYTIKVKDGKERVEFFLSHYAHRVWNKSHHGTYHLYGHSHGSLPDDPNSRSMDVGVDCFDFKPISLWQAKEILDKKEWKPIDHHGD